MLYNIIRIEVYMDLKFKNYLILAEEFLIDGDLDKAEDLLLKSLKFTREADVDEKISVYFELTDIYLKKENYDEAKLYFEKIDYLREISRKKTLWLELGMQSVNENTIKLINRGYTHEIFDETVKKLKDANILFLIHAIFGLPFEDQNDFKNTIKYIREVAPFGVKFHNLYILKGSPIYELYKNKKFRLLSREEYTQTILYALENINEKTVVHRITGDPPKKNLFEPKWCADKLSVISEIDKRLKELDKDILKDEQIKNISTYWKEIDLAFSHKT